jgi:poly(3-hydroxyalkanoate) synthetase
MEGMKAFKNVNVCVTQGGHVAGIVHDPRGNRYANVISNACLNAFQVIDMMHAAKDLSDKKSWWQNWLSWIKEDMITLPKAKRPRVSKIEAAPGRYVKQEVEPLQIQY